MNREGREGTKPENSLRLFKLAPTVRLRFMFGTDFILSIGPGTYMGRVEEAGGGGGS